MDGRERFRLLREFRNSVRDAAYRKHGERWREYVSWGGYWSPQPQNEEERVFLVRLDAATATLRFPKGL
jgi:hypothetical protein